MTEYLTVEDIEEIHKKVMDRIGGSHGIRDPGALKSAVSQPAATFDGEDLYVGMVEKASTLGFSLVNNHPFIDGNKRTGYMATRIFLNLNGYELAGRSDDKQATILAVAAGRMDRTQFADWIRDHLDPREEAVHGDDEP